MPGSNLGGFAEGFWGVVGRQREEEAAEHARRLQLEGSILRHLATADDPQIQALALQGLLDAAGPSKQAKGWGGFLGQQLANPAVGQLQRLLGTPVQESRQVPTPDFEAAAAPLRPQGAALPAAATVDPEATAAPLSFQASPPPMRTEVTERPRRPFLTPEERYLQQARGKAQGDVEGEVAGLVAGGFSEAEARELIRKRYERLYRGGRGATLRMQAKAVELPDGTQTMAVFDPGSGKFLDPDTGEVIADAMPLQRTGSMSMGADRESVALELFGSRYVRLPPDAQAQVNREVQRREIETAQRRARATGDEQIVTARGTDLAKPVGVQTGAEQGVDPTMPLGGMAGTVPITDQQRERRTASQALRPSVEGMKGLVPKVFPAGSGLIGGLKASAVLAAKRAARDPELAQLEAYVQMAKGNIAKVLAGESGRLTEQDAIRAQAALANLESGLLRGDTAESALSRLAIVEEALNNIDRDIQSVGEQLQQQGRGQGKGTAGPPARPAAATAPPPGAPPAAAPTAQPYPIGAELQHRSGRRFRVKGYTPEGKIIPEWID